MAVHLYMKGRNIKSNLNNLQEIHIKIIFNITPYHNESKLESSAAKLDSKTALQTNIKHDIYSILK